MGTKPRLKSTTLAPLPDGGVTHVTPGEVRLLCLLNGGMANQEIADLTLVSVNTVRAQIHMLMERTGMSNRTELALWYERTPALQTAYQDTVRKEMEATQ